MDTPLSRLASRCRQCLATGGGAEEIRALVEQALGELAGGPPQEAIDEIVHRTEDLLVVGLAQPPYANTPVHDHGGIWCVIGMAIGREENALYEESAGGVVEVDRLVVAAGEAVVLPPSAIHRIRNPDGVTSLGVHVYGADLLMASIAYYILSRSLVVLHGRNSPFAAALGSDLKGRLSLMLYAIAIPLTFLSPWISLAIYAGVALVWLVPDRRFSRASGN